MPRLPVEKPARRLDERPQHQGVLVPQEVHVIADFGPLFGETLLGKIGIEAQRRIVGLVVRKTHVLVVRGDLQGRLVQMDEFAVTHLLVVAENDRGNFNKDGIAIPQNLIVVGTVNMDETTFSFSRKVLDRAMTIEMNEVDLYGGLDDRHEKIGKLEAGNLIGTAVEGVDVYRENKEVCDTALKYLQAVNLDLDGTPFKVAYRTRNEFLLYVVNNLPYNKDKEGNEISQQEVIARALDEITSMKILSRIEGDSDKIGNLLEELGKTVSEQLKVISGKDYSEKKNDGEKVYSVSLAKLKEMEGRLKSGYTSFWS